jgi:hypothetical protein
MNFPIVKGWKENFDWWSWVHFLGLVPLARIWGPAAAFVLVWVWELLDTAYSLGRQSLWYFMMNTMNFSGYSSEQVLLFVDRKIFDPRGFSYGDILCGSGGILLFLVLQRIF